jgi:hypothetical protein
MNYDEYKSLALRTPPPKFDLACPGLAPYNASVLIHAALGLGSEALELHHENWRGAVALQEQLMELGDICWFANLACHEFDVFPTMTVDYPKYGGLPTLYLRCEEFVSRVKSGIYYGSPIKPGEKMSQFTNLPAEIIGRAHAVSLNHLERGATLFSLNIAKLRTRFPDKFTGEIALARDIMNEHKVVSDELAKHVPGVVSLAELQSVGLVK